VSPDVVQRLIGVNLIAPINLTVALLPYLISRKRGRLVQVCRTDWPTEQATHRQAINQLQSELDAPTADGVVGVGAGIVGLVWGTTRGLPPAAAGCFRCLGLQVSSAAGTIPSPGQAIYAAAKLGSNGFFSSLTTELCDKQASSHCSFFSFFTFSFFSFSPR
jgi:NAD(P)-dependent dehydrogenase (short-subunit alcohol dehydrogenase family)